MRVDTASGLHGTLIEYRADDERSGTAIVLRDEPTFAQRPFSVHRLYRSQIDGKLMAESGNYDMTLAQAQAVFDAKASLREAAA